MCVNEQGLLVGLLGLLLGLSLMEHSLSGRSMTHLCYIGRKVWADILLIYLHIFQQFMLLSTWLVIGTGYRSVQLHTACKWHKFRIYIYIYIYMTYCYMFLYLSILLVVTNAFNGLIYIYLARCHLCYIIFPLTCYLFYSTDDDTTSSNRSIHFMVHNILFHILSI